MKRKLKPFPYHLVRGKPPFSDVLEFFTMQELLAKFHAMAKMAERLRRKSQKRDFKNAFVLQDKRLRKKNKRRKEGK